MAGLLDWGIEVVLWLQQFSPGLDLPFRLLSFLGSQTWFMLLLPVLYWCGDRREARRLIVLFLISALLNGTAKDLLGQPRPFAYDPLVRQLEGAAGGGLPSGHTQGAVVVYGYLALRARRFRGWVIAAVLASGVAVSRVYLGAHFPTDLAGGLALGALVLAGGVGLEKRAAAWIARLGFNRQLAAVFILPMALSLSYPGEGGEGPAAAAAALAGMAAGFAAEPRLVAFDSGGSARRRLLRALAGSLGLFVLDVGLKQALKAVPPEELFTALRYALLGGWVGIGAPYIFVRLRLAERCHR